MNDEAANPNPTPSSTHKAIQPSAIEAKPNTLSDERDALQLLLAAIEEQSAAFKAVAKFQTSPNIVDDTINKAIERLQQAQDALDRANAAYESFRRGGDSPPVPGAGEQNERDLPGTRERSTAAASAGNRDEPPPAGAVPSAAALQIAAFEKDSRIGQHQNSPHPDATKTANPSLKSSTQAKPGLAGAATPAGQADPEIHRLDPQSVSPAQETRAFSDTHPPEREPPRITLSAPAGALHRIFTALHEEKKKRSPPNPAVLAGDAEIFRRLEKFDRDKVQSRHDTDLLDSAKASANAARAAIQSFNNQCAAIINRMQEAADAAPGGMPAVIAGMKPGGPYEDLRQAFNSALGNEPALAQSYKTAISTLSLYGEQRAGVNQLLAAPANAGQFQTFNELDLELAKAAAKLPGLQDGASAIDELAEKARDILHKAFDRVRSTVLRAARAGAEAGPSPSPSP